MHDEFMRHQDHSYFQDMSKAAILALLAQHEQAGTLKSFIGQVAPDYLMPGGEVMVFSLVADLKL